MAIYAVVDLNGQQVSVEEDRYVVVNRLPQAPGDTIELDKVLMVVNGSNSLVGAPYVTAASVKAQVLDHFRGPKKLVYKMRCKKGYRRKNGYRDDLTKLQIVSVDFTGKPAKVTKPKTEETAAPAKKAASKVADENPSEKPAAEKKTKTTTAKSEGGAEVKAKAPKAVKPEAKAEAKPKKAAAEKKAKADE